MRAFFRSTKAQVSTFFILVGSILLGRASASCWMRTRYCPRLNDRSCVIAGFGYEFDKVRARISELNLTGSVRLVGRVDEAGRSKLLAGCRLVCFPSQEEMFGMVITEACAAARPVIYWDLPPMNEIADKAGCIAVPPFDVTAYAAAMRDLIEASDEEILARGRACRARVQNYRWDAIAIEQEEFYLERMSRVTRR